MICNNAKSFANLQMIFKPSKTRMISVSIIIYCFYTKVICRNANNFCLCAQHDQQLGGESPLR
ncbi:hypothetical protein KUA25_24845, partial [Bacteroidales bacterium MSK.15.36]|nr:hypothetical protein [Bacteroidales bacterium MSK.15.36]